MVWAATRGGQRHHRDGGEDDGQRCQGSAQPPAAQLRAALAGPRRAAGVHVVEGHRFERIERPRG